MSFTEALPPKKAETNTGISCSLRENKGGNTVRIFISAAKQIELFGKSIGGEKCKALVGRDDDEGKLRIILDSDGLLELKESVKGSASVAIRAWDLLPETARPGRQIVTFENDAKSVTLILPPWSRPNGAGGKVEERSKGKPEPKAKSPQLSPATTAGRLQQQARQLENASGKKG